jgi:hypothetical protein
MAETLPFLLRRVRFMPMRAVVFAVSLAACATAPISADNFGLIGCWAHRADARTEAMNWRADAAGGLQGELISFAPGEASAPRNHFTLAQIQDGWRLCETSAADQPCWQVAHERTGSLAGGRAFIDRFDDRLRIGVVDADGAERKIFEGERQACPA